jgi:bifunctional oligoribonuclease and PAP phosphatase NrnA
MTSKEMYKVINEIKQYDDFIITTHVNPEGDAIGSVVAMEGLLQQLGKSAVMVVQDKVPANLKFLKGTELITEEVPLGFTPRTALVLDCPVIERAGKIATHVAECKSIINIDHHISNEFFADVNWVDPEASSVGEMIYSIIEGCGEKVDMPMAEAIYTAMITDTGMFNYNNTRYATHKIAGMLLKVGVDPKRMYTEIFENKSPVNLRVLGRVLTTLEVEESGKIAVMTLTVEMRKKEGVKNLSTDEFINYPRSVKGVEVAVFFNESVNDEAMVNISFRSNGDICVNRIASMFGGGGHPKASGCLVTGNLEEVKQTVMEKVRGYVRGE